MKRIFAIAAAILVCISLGLIAVYAIQSIDADVAMTVAANLGETNQKTLTGANGTCLLVDSISDSEYNEMMRVLYPDSPFDEQGLSLPGVNNFDEARAKFIADHTKAYAINGTETAEVEITPHLVELENTLIPLNPYKKLLEQK